MIILTRNNQKEQQGPFVVSFAISILLHLCFCLMLTVDKPEVHAKQIEISLLPTQEKLTKKNRPQIVSPSKAEKTPKPPDTHHLSDENTATRVEQIRRGLPESSGEKKTDSEIQQKTARAITPISPQPKKSIPKNPTLRLSASLIERTIPLKERPSDHKLPPPQKKQEQAPDKQRTQELQEYKPFRPQNSETLFSSKRGIPDHLPDIQDGEITLLNAKADRHAVFVRRVAYQVFGALRRESWHTIPFTQVRAINDFVTVHASMSPTGEFLKVELIFPCGSALFDKALLKAARTGTWDQNPPPSASASDGNIHFVFKSKTWARAAGESIFEQRWLLLSTGLL